MTRTLLIPLLLLAILLALQGCRFHIDAAPRIIIQSDEVPVPLD